jgi:flagella basal body P-ring formation protein FlgA
VKVVVANRALSIRSVIRPEDVTLLRVSVEPVEGAFNRIADVVCKTVTRDVAPWRALRAEDVA